MSTAISIQTTRSIEVIMGLIELEETDLMMGYKFILLGIGKYCSVGSIHHFFYYFF